MTPNEKAKELVKIYYKLLPISASFLYSLNICKQCALIAVDEILNMLIGSFATIQYWEEVKKEIKKL